MTQKTFSKVSIYLAYSAPHITTYWLIAPVGVVQGIYAKYYGLSLTTIAAIVLVARLFDAITDPLIGYLSDRYYRYSGTRKPFMLTGGLLFILSSYFLYVPPLQVTAIYFITWFMAVYLAWTLFEIPHIAWAGDLALNSQDKTKIYSFRSIAGYFGQLLFYSVPLLPIFPTREITPETLRVSVIAAGTLMALFLYYCLKVTPDRSNPLRKTNVDSPNRKVSSDVISLKTMRSRKLLVLLLSSFSINRPLFLFICAYLFNSISAGMWFGLIFIYVDAYLNLGAQFAQMFIIAFAVGIITTPFWCKIANSLGKKNAWLLAMVLIISSFIYTGTLTPGNTDFRDLLALKTMQTIGYSCMLAIAPAMVSEISDYGKWKTGSDQTATYFSLYTFCMKASGAIGLALGLSIAGWYNFDASASIHSEYSVDGLILAITWVPLVFGCIATIFIALSPINIHRHTIIRRRLDASKSVDQT